MQSSFYLGINQLWDELLVMQKPGLYWVNADRQDDAITLCRQTLNRQEPNARLAFINAGESTRNVIDENQFAQPTELPLFYLPATHSAILRLVEDLMRSLKTANRLYVLHTATELWKSLTVSELIGWLADMNQWLVRQNGTLVVFNYGIEGDNLRSHLVLQHRSLSGLASLIHSNGELHYEVDFWCNNRGVFARQNLNLIADENKLRAEGDRQEQSKFVSDEELYLAVKTIFDGGQPLPENWQLFNNNESLAAAGLSVRAATLIFALDRREQIDELVYLIYNLRQQKGNGIKIIVRAMTPSLRSNDEYILLAGGANLVTHYLTPIETFFNEVESVQGQIFSRYIPADINALLKAIKPLPLRGYVDNQTFSKSVISLIHNGLLPEDNKGVLLSLIPVAGLTAKQALTLCRVRRDGDLVTLFDEKLILFLSNCKVNELNTTLRFIFQLPVDQVFGERSVWSRDGEILANMYQLQAQSSTEANDLSAAEINQTVSPAISADRQGSDKVEEKPTYNPEPIALKVGNS